MAHLAGVKSGEMSNSHRSPKAADLSESRGYPWGCLQGGKLLDFARGFCDASRGGRRRDIQIVKEREMKVS